MLPIAASASLAVALSVAPPAALADESLLLEELALPDEPDEPEEPEEPDELELPDELAVVEADDAALDDVESPLLSAVVWDAVSQAAMKKATATSAIRRCNMLMLPVFRSGSLTIRLTECFCILAGLTSPTARCAPTGLSPKKQVFNQPFRIRGHPEP